MTPEIITIKEYLDRKGIAYKESGSEIRVKCLFNNCDEGSRANEFHLYFNAKTSQYHCKKCESKGNITTLAKHFGDPISEISLKHKEGSKKSPPKKRDLSLIVKQCHEKMPQTIRAWLNKRGITNDLIKEYELGYGEFYHKHWITIPVTNNEGTISLIKLRRDPTTQNDQSKYSVFPEGARHEIYGWEMLKNNEDDIVICEGEFDRLILIAKGVPAITSTGGVGTFKNEWLTAFKKIQKIYICFDSDAPGETGMSNLAQKFLDLEVPSVYRIKLPDMGEGKNDITDYFIDHKGNVDSLMELAKVVTTFSAGERIKKLGIPPEVVTFTQWKNTILNYFPDCHLAAEACLSVIAQILIRDITNPFALVLIDMPSAGKTITLNFFAEIENLTYCDDDFSAASFVSNAANLSADKLSKVDLLPRIRYKTFIVRDLAPLFGKRDDDLLKSLGYLTRVLDGEGFQTDSGVHGHRGYVGEYLFMMLAASTPIRPKVWNLMGNLGGRLFFINMNSRNKDEDELAGQLIDKSYKDKEKACRIITKNFLLSLWEKYPEGVEWNKTKDSEDCRKIIARCAQLLAQLRGTVNVWKVGDEDSDQYSFTMPVIEKPDRINQLLYNFARAHALICNRNNINRDDLRLIIELALDSAPITRSKLFHALINNRGRLTTSQVEVALNCSKPTALKEMETLKILHVAQIHDVNDGGVGEREKMIMLELGFWWFAANECCEIRGVPLPSESALSDES